MTALLKTMRERLAGAKRWVVKVGSSSLTNDGHGLDHTIMAQWTEQVAQLLASGKQVVLVSSGSIAEGIHRLGWQTRPTEVHALQAAAAVGQMGLIQAYESGFQRFGYHTAQILLTHDDFANRRRYLNARATLNTLLERGVVPIVNENDTVITDEIRLGDNDTLAAQVTNLLHMDVLVLLTDQEGLFDRDPRRHSDATLLERANASDPAVLELAGPSGTTLGSGGMRTKVLAAERAAESGATTVIANGRVPNVLLRLAAGEAVGTMLTSNQPHRDARKRWLSDHLRVKGKLTLDAGACAVLRSRGSSLLAVGVIACEGEFQRGELIACIADDGTEIARGLTNYDATATRRLLGQPSERFVDILGYTREPELIHRDNMVVA